MKRKVEAILAIILKCLFIYDLLHLLLIKPIEGLFYQRLSSSLIISSGNTLHMSLTFSEISKLRRTKSQVKKLLIIKNSFLSGLQKLDFNKGQKYNTYVNEGFYDTLAGDKKMESQGIISFTISTDGKNQAEAKLLLLKSSHVWKELISRNRSKFLKFLLRKEKVLQIEFQRKYKER